MDYKVKLEEIEATIQENKEKLIRLQEKQKQLTEQKDEIMVELTELKLTPETLEEEINKLDKEIDMAIAKAENILNPVIEDEQEPED